MNARLVLLVVCAARCTHGVVVSGGAGAGSEDKGTPPGLVQTNSEHDLQAEATHTGAAQKREAPPALSNSYGEPLPPDVYGVPLQQQQQGLPLPVPVYGVPDHPSNNIQYPAPPPDIPPPPPGAYGPPQPLPAPIGLPQQNYGVPDFNINLQELLNNHVYEGPPPPIFKPKPNYGPPKQQYGPPKPTYGPPKPSKNYGPPKQSFSLPKPQYGLPFKNHGPPKYSAPKPNYGPPKISHAQTKPVYGPPKPIYGVPKPLSVPKPEYGPPKLEYGPPKLEYGPPKLEYGPPQLPLFSNVNFFQQNLQSPAPIYGPPLTALPQNLKPNFPVPSDTYGPPGHFLGPNDNLVLPEHYGPPQPDPNPRPPHPGIPAPPTPPHVLYDGWKPIPGVSIPQFAEHQHNHLDQHHHNHIEQHQHNQQHQQIDQHNHNHIQQHQQVDQHQHNHIQQHQQIDQHQHNHIEQHRHIENSHDQSQDQYGPPPPPPPQINQDFNLNVQNLNLDGTALPYAAPPPDFNSGSGHSVQSSIHADALSNIDLSFVGGDTNHIDQAKTVFEAHYTEQVPSAPTASADNNIESLSLIQNIGAALSDSYGAPPQDSFSPSGPYPGPRQLGAKGLQPPATLYGVPRGPPHNLPLAYGVPSGSTGGHSFHAGGSAPKHPIKFREPVPQGLIQDIGLTVVHKDTHGLDRPRPGPAYLPPPIRDTNQHSGGISLSIEPSHLYSLPHSGNPVSFQAQHHNIPPPPSGLYGSPIDSYAAPLLTVSDTASASSNQNSVTASIDGNILSSLDTSILNNLDAAAILKHCPYHEAILKAARQGERIPAELASSYVASLSSLGSSLSKNQQTLMTPQNSFNTPAPGSDSVNYNTQDLATASHTLVQTILPAGAAISTSDNKIQEEKTENTSSIKGKSLKTDTKQIAKEERIQNVSEQIQKTSEKIKSLSEEAKQIQQKILLTSQSLNHGAGGNIPVRGQHGTYTLQIQSADDGISGTRGKPTVPHEQLLSEELLQSILQAIEQPSSPQKNTLRTHMASGQQVQFQQSNVLDISGGDAGGIELPAGYEPVDRTKQNQAPERNNQQASRPKEPAPVTDQEIQSTHNNIQQILNSEVVNAHRGDIPVECDMKHSQSIRHTVVVRPPPASFESTTRLAEVVTPLRTIDDNEVAVYFDSRRENEEPITEISVATSISEGDDDRRNSQQYDNKSSEQKTNSAGKSAEAREKDGSNFGEKLKKDV